MPILSRRARHVRAKGTALEQILDDWYAVTETAAANSIFTIPGSQGLVVSMNEQGGSVISTPTQRVAYQQKELLLVRPQTAYEEQVLSHKNWRARYLVFNGLLSDRFANTYWPKPTDCLGLIEAAPPTLRQNIQELIRLSFTQPPHWDWMFLKLVSQLFEDMVHHASELAHQQSLSARAKSTVHRDIQRPWSVDELAYTLNVSTSQLAHEFRNKTGISPGQWIRTERLKHARSLLRQGLKVTQVADEMGYANPFNFTRAYKAAFNILPSNESRAAPKVLH